MERNMSKVYLIASTPNALKVIASQQLNMRGNMVKSVDEVSDSDAERLVLDVFKTNLSGALEFVDLVWNIENVTRSFCLAKGTKIIVKKFRDADVIDVKNNRVSAKKGSDFRGTKDIDKMEIGDEVLSYNETTGEKEWDKVIFVSKHWSDDWYKIKFDNNNELEMTNEHPVYVVGRKGESKPRWIKAEDLRVGDEVIQLRYLGIHARTYNINKTLEQNYGKDKADKIKSSVSKRQTGSYISRYGEKATEEAEKRTKHFKNKSYELLLGDKKGKEMRKIRSRDAKKQHLDDPTFRRHGSDALKKEWLENREKMIEVARQAGIKSNSSYFGKMGSSEKKLSYLLRFVAPGEFKYNGDGRLGVVLGYRTPDFVNVNGKKKVVELFGCYWHGCKECGFDKRMVKNNDVSNYGKLGYDCSVVWEHELKDEENLKIKLKTFVYNPGVDVVKVAKIKRSRINRLSYNIETEKNHNFFAYGILTHNTHQLVRYRVGTSFSQESMRFVNKAGFEYLTGKSIKTLETKTKYDDMMKQINGCYQDLIDMGVETQDARGVLPTNIFTKIGFKCTYRTLYNIAQTRLCLQAQEQEWRDVIGQMKTLVAEKVSPVLADNLQPICYHTGSCEYGSIFDRSCPLQEKYPVKNRR